MLPQSQHTITAEMEHIRRRLRFWQVHLKDINLLKESDRAQFEENCRFFIEQNQLKLVRLQARMQLTSCSISVAQSVPLQLSPA